MEEKKAVFIRGVNTNEDSPNAQHTRRRRRNTVKHILTESKWRLP